MQEDQLAHRAIEATGLTKPKWGVKPGSKRNRAARALPQAVADDEVMQTMAETQVFFGGPGRPIHPSTLYRESQTASTRGRSGSGPTACGGCALSA